MSHPPLHPVHLALVAPPPPSRTHCRFDRLMRKLYRTTLLAAQWTDQRTAVRSVASWELQPVKLELNRQLKQLALRFDEAQGNPVFDELDRIKLSWLICAFAEQVLMLEDDDAMVDLLDRHDVARGGEELLWDDEDIFAASGMVHIPPSAAPPSAPLPPPPPVIDHVQALWMLREIWHDKAGLAALDEVELETWCSLARCELSAVSAVLFSLLLRLAEEWELPLDEITPAGAIHTLRQDVLEVQAKTRLVMRQLEDFADLGALRARLARYELPDDARDREGAWFFEMEDKPDWGLLLHAD